MSIEEQKAAQAVDVLAVMDCLVDLARHRLTMKRRDFDRKVVAGKRPHYDDEIKADRADYIFQQSREARAIVAKLIERDRTAGYTHEDVMLLVKAARLSQEFADGLHGMSRNNAEAIAGEVGDALVPALAPFTNQSKDGSR